jgi:hypothetical protein
MPEIPFTTTQTKDLIKKIDHRIDRDRSAQDLSKQKRDQSAVNPADWYDAMSFESDITSLLSHLFPCSVLSSVRIFSSESMDHDVGYEVDNLMHFRSGGDDFIVFVETKKQSIRLHDGSWFAKYGESEKDILAQMDNHFRTLWEYLEPIAGNRNLKFIALVVCSDRHTPQKVNRNGYRNGETHLCSFKELPVVLKSRFGFVKGGGGALEAEVLRVSQSQYLDLLRWGAPIPELGHPELTSAIRYVGRCRRELDLALFKHFDPSEERWVINGSAGMGKSVLLAYSAAVLCTGYMIRRVQQDYYGDPADLKFEKMGFNPDPKAGRVIVMAMSQRQLDNLREWYEEFSKKLSKASKMRREYAESAPEFVLFRREKGFSGITDCRALLIDESHDLPPEASEELVSLCRNAQLYLMLACDRHQRLRFGSEDASIVKGLDFQRKSKRLKRIYRNPAPVYLASLAVMFRWFANEGPKVIPTNKELEEQFGLQPVSMGGTIALRMINDTHPANSWSHCVDSFPDAATAYEFLMRERMRHKDVLWVRYSMEDPDFDYEQVSNRFTYHNCRHYDSVEICDKYIKGQDFPVVVIEGFPSFMDRYEDHESGKGARKVKVSAEEAERRMWAFRRELYLCASRATTFLYFITHNQSGAEYDRIRDEMEALIEALSAPDPEQGGGSSNWKILIGITEQRRKQEVFHDLDLADITMGEDLESEVIPPAANSITENPSDELVHETEVPAIKQKVSEDIMPVKAEPPSIPSPTPELKSFDALAGLVQSIEPETPKLTTMKPLPRIGATTASPDAPSIKEEASKKTQDPLPVIRMRRPIIVSTLAEEMEIDLVVLMNSLKAKGVFCTRSAHLRPDQAERVCREHGFRFVHM